MLCKVSLKKIVNFIRKHSPWSTFYNKVSKAWSLKIPKKEQHGKYFPVNIEYFWGTALYTCEKLHLTIQTLLMPPGINIDKVGAQSLYKELLTIKTLLMSPGINVDKVGAQSRYKELFYTCILQTTVMYINKSLGFKRHLLSTLTKFSKI